MHDKFTADSSDSVSDDSVSEASVSEDSVASFDNRRNVLQILHRYLSLCRLVETNISYHLFA